jgi:pyrrolidone-carboxylate peptidase
MARVLLTAFGPYGSWESNASWLALTELTRELPSLPQVTTRLYPTDYLSLGRL